MDKEYLNPPNPEVVNWISSRIKDLGICYDKDTIAVVVAAYEDILKNNFGMKNHIVDLLQFDWSRGESNKEYEIAGEVVKGDDVTFMHTVVNKSKFISPRLIKEREIQLEGCEACGILSHCTKEVRNKINDRLERLCNHCLIYDEQLRDEGDKSLCDKCTKDMCEHKKEARRLA